MALQYVTARLGPKYPFEYTQALNAQVPGLVCLGDDRPLRTQWQGWWCKAEAFAPWNEDLRPCLWIDLDTYVFDLSPFDDVDDQSFWMIDDFNNPERGESGLMLLPKDTTHIWNALRSMKINYASPDAAFLRQFPHKRLNREVDGIYSYKKHCKEKVPDDAVICCFHGKPKPPETDGWSIQHWRTLTSPTTKF